MLEIITYHLISTTELQSHYYFFVIMMYATCFTEPLPTSFPWYLCTQCWFCGSVWLGIVFQRDIRFFIRICRKRKLNECWLLPWHSIPCKFGLKQYDCDAAFAVHDMAFVVCSWSLSVFWWILIKTIFVPIISLCLNPPPITCAQNPLIPWQDIIQKSLKWWIH